MSSIPAWLPPQVQISKSWHVTLEKLYDVFLHDFVRDMPTFCGMRVLVDRRRKDDTREEGFWHLITKTEPGQGRIPNFDRARRIAWVRAMIEHADAPEVLRWESLHKSGKGKMRLRNYIWLEAEDFVVVLERRKKPVVFLVTAYCVEGERQRQKLRRSYSNCISQKQSPPPNDIG